jgi:hypothetical protein
VEVMPHIFLANDALRAAREQSSVDPSRRVTITNKLYRNYIYDISRNFF